jgi:ribosomal protein S18 acetylase RimI-like enzyme
MHAMSQAEQDPGTSSLSIRRARAQDVALVSALDAEVTGLAKPDYWRDVFERYGERRLDERFFLIAEVAGRDRHEPILGFIVGEVRAWEFGSQPCGWVFAFSVEPEARLKGVGTSLFEAIAAEFKGAGVDKMRTMVARNNDLHMTFFRSEGMMAGPYIQLEIDLD